MCDVCEYCGAPKQKFTKLNSLSVGLNPLLLFYHGTPVLAPRFTPVELKTISRLIEFGPNGASNLALGMVTKRGGEFVSDPAVKVRIHHLRNKLRQLHPDFQIECVRDWGYVIRFPADDVQPVALAA